MRMTARKVISYFLRSGLNFRREIRTRHRVLLPCCQVFKREDAGAHLVLAGDQSIFCAHLAGGFERLLQTKILVPKFDDDIVAAKLTRKTGGFLVHTGGKRSDVNVWLAENLLRRFAQRHDEPVFADGKSNSRSLRAADHFGESVITSAAEDRILRAQR